MLIGLGTCYAQSTLTKPHRDVLTVEYGGEWIMDGYLSPLVYDGQMIGIRNEWWNGWKENWDRVGNLQVRGSKVLSERKNNYIYTLDLQGGWGAMNHWQWDFSGKKITDWQQLKLAIGPYLGADIMLKELAGNVNKPYSADIALDACVMASVQYAFRCKKTAYAVGYSLQMNMIGIEWLPDYWTSYYEVTEKVRLKESIAFSHVFNRQHLQQQVYIDFQFLHSSWRVGLKHEYLTYGSHTMPFRRQVLSGCIGALFNYQTTPAAVITPF